LQKLNFQWFKDGLPIQGATNWEYILDDAPVTAAGNYSVRIENTVGVYTSKNIPVNVLDKPMLQLINPKLVENFFIFELPEHYTGSYSVICKDTIDEQQWIFLKRWTQRMVLFRLKVSLLEQLRNFSD